MWLLAALSLGVHGQIIPDMYVLELDSAPAPGKVRAVASVRSAQTALRGALTARLAGRVEVRDQTEVVMNALIVRTDATANELASVPGVRKVWPVFQVRREMDRAEGLLNARGAYESLGGSANAGKGIKIGIVDTGLDVRHPGFAVEGWEMPEGYPKASSEALRELTGGKIVAYRSYDDLLGEPESGVDAVGHGTGVSMVAAGVKHQAPLAEIQGIAPGAYLGIYRVFSGPEGEYSSTAVLMKALDDAVADGMDVINMSLGFNPTPSYEFDPFVPVVERAASLGVTIIKSSGNDGPARYSGSAPAMGSNGLTVGSAWSDRIFASGLRVNDLPPIFALPGSGPAPEAPVSAPITDITAVDQGGLACETLPRDAFTGRIVLILRGTCSFSVKLANVREAGAAGAIVYTDEARPAPSIMAVEGETLPAAMISYRDGISLKAYLGEVAESTATIDLAGSMVFPLDSDSVESSSSRGPGSDYGVRPDFIAIGENIYTAAQKTNPDGALFGVDGYTMTAGTSFASPMAAGAYAILKAARPGLRADQYRSLLTNTALPFPVGGELPAPVQVGGAGRLDITAALNGRLTMRPPSITFGLGGQRIDADRILHVENASANVGTWTVEVNSGNEVKPLAEPSEFSLGPGDAVDIRVRLSADVPAGEYEGFLLFRRVDAQEGERPQRAAYWYGVPADKPAAAFFLPSPPQAGRTGSVSTLYLTVTDAIGAPADSERPSVTLAEGSGDLIGVDSLSPSFPAYWRIRVRLGRGINRFRVSIGELEREVTIIGQ